MGVGRDSADGDVVVCSDGVFLFFVGRVWPVGVSGLRFTCEGIAERFACNGNVWILVLHP